MANILYTKRPIVVNPELAVRIGLNEAIVLQQLNYWLCKTSSGVEYNGARWVYNSYSEWSEQIPFISERTIQRVLIKLEKMGIVQSKMLNKARGDRTKFYTINNDSEHLSSAENPSCQNGSTMTTNRHDHSAKLAPSSCQGGTLFTETTTETTSNINKILPDHSEAEKPKPKKRKSSLPENFKPTAQHESLANDLGVNLNHEIQQFIDYHTAKDSKYVDWHAALRTWIRNAAKWSKGSKNKKTGYFREEAKNKDYWEGINDDGTF